MTVAERELRALPGDSAVLAGTTRDYLHDATESRNVSGRADAMALPADPAQVAEAMAWCYGTTSRSSPAAAAPGSRAGRYPTAAWC